MLRTLEAETVMPSVAHSPTMRKVALARVLLRQTDNEGEDGIIESVVNNRAVAREDPVSSDELAVPAKQRRWRDEVARPVFTRQKPSERREQLAIGGGVAGPCHLAPQHRDLMTEHSDLDVFLARRRPESQEVEQSSDE
jgi:hypothetical protein